LGGVWCFRKGGEKQKNSNTAKGIGKKGGESSKKTHQKKKKNGRLPLQKGNESNMSGGETR